MTLLFEKYRPIVSPALAPAQLCRADEFDSSQKTADAVLTIGLINNMPDSALQATERQSMRLLKAASGNNRVHFHCFSLPSVNRSPPAKYRVDTQYRDIADLDRLQIDGLIVTGAEPNAATLPEEPFWETADVPSSLKVAHSRVNELQASDLAAHGYQLLTESREAGVDIFAKQLRSRFIFFQGHPEYDALSLQREYLRDITRFLSGERDTYPAIPAGYFETETETRLAGFQKRARVERKLPLSAELPGLRVRPDIAAGAAAIAIFRNWLEYLSDGARPALPSVDGGSQR